MKIPPLAIHLLSVVFLLPMASNRACAAGETDSPELFLKEAVICRSVGNDLIPLDKIHQRPVVRGPVAIFNRLGGNKQTLEWLKQNKLLPIKHIWIHKGAVSMDGTREPIAVGDIGQFKRLQAEVDEDGWFDWRTWSSKRNLIPGSYEVWIVFANNQPVLMEDGTPAKLTFDFNP